MAVKTRNELLADLETAILFSGYEIKETNYNTKTTFSKIRIAKNNQIELEFIIKNIVNSGWSHKPLIRRVQIRNIPQEELTVSSMTQTSIIIGVIDVIDKTMFVAWSPYLNSFHRTNRSCYVQLSTVFQGYLKGYFSSVESNQRIWISDNKNLHRLLYNYLKSNNIGE